MAPGYVRRMTQEGTKRSVTAIILMVIGGITVVVVLVALVRGAVEGPRVQHLFGEAKVDTRRTKLKKYAFEAYPSWSAAHPDKACPDKLSDLSEYMNNEDSNDSWGKPIRMLCGQNMPRGAKGLATVSRGEDG